MSADQVDDVDQAEEFDVIVLGAGPVENVASRCRAGGLSVALVERELVGGECSYWGCARQFPRLAGIYPDERSLLVAPLIVEEHVFGVLALTFRGESRSDEQTQRAFLTTLADVTAQALRRAAATAAATAASERLRFLADASMAFAVADDQQAVLDAVATLTVPRVADWCVIELAESGRLVAATTAHRDPTRASWAAEMAARYPVNMEASAGSPHVFRTGTSQLLREVGDQVLVGVAVDDDHLRLLRGLGISSAMVVPLIGRVGSIGAITFIRGDSPIPYGDDDLALAEDLAHRAALAVETARARTMNSASVSVPSSRAADEHGTPAP